MQNVLSEIRENGEGILPFFVFFFFKFFKFFLVPRLWVLVVYTYLELALMFN